MISKASQKVKCLIIRLLESDSLNKVSNQRKNIISVVLWHYLGIKGRINFLQLERYSGICEQTFRNHFEQSFDFMAFNTEMINSIDLKDRVIAFDPSYIPKTGKCTYGGSYFWSGAAKSAKWGLDICGFAVVDTTKGVAFHLNAWQTPSASDLNGSNQTLLGHYAKLISDNASHFKGVTDYVVGDAYFSKKPVLDAVLTAKLHLISRLRGDSVLKYIYYGERTGKKGAPKKYNGKVDVKNLNIDYFTLDTDNDEVKIYSAIVYSQAFKRNIKLAVAIFVKDKKEVARKLYFSTDLTLSGKTVVRYYRSRFQIEFLYRDAKQYTGLTNCQARSENKLDFHFNAALTAVNIAKQDWITTKSEDDKVFSMANYKTLYNNTLLLERFICKFGINPHTQKNQKTITELLDYGKISA